MRGLQLFDRVHADRGLGEAGDHGLEISVLADEIGFRVHFDGHTATTFDQNGHKTFGGGTVGFLGSFRQTLGAQPVDRGFHVAIGFGQRFFRVHHARARTVAQVFYQCSCDRHRSALLG